MSDIPAHGPHPGLVTALQRRERFQALRAECAADTQALRQFAEEHGTTPAAVPSLPSVLVDRPLSPHLERVEALIAQAHDLQRRIDKNNAEIRRRQAVPAEPPGRWGPAIALAAAVVVVVVSVVVWMLLR